MFGGQDMGAPGKIVRHLRVIATATKPVVVGRHEGRKAESVIIPA